MHSSMCRLRSSFVRRSHVEGRVRALERASAANESVAVSLRAGQRHEVAARRFQLPGRWVQGDQPRGARRRIPAVWVSSFRGSPRVLRCDSPQFQPRGVSVQIWEAVWGESTGASLIWNRTGTRPVPAPTIVRLRTCGSCLELPIHVVAWPIWFWCLVCCFWDGLHESKLCFVDPVRFHNCFYHSIFFNCTFWTKNSVRLGWFLTSLTSRHPPMALNSSGIPALWVSWLLNLGSWLLATKRSWLLTRP